MPMMLANFVFVLEMHSADTDMLWGFPGRHGRLSNNGIWSCVAGVSMEASVLMVFRII